jgi:hypothetical protein
MLAPALPARTDKKMTGTQDEALRRAAQQDLLLYRAGLGALSACFAGLSPSLSLARALSLYTHTHTHTPPDVRVCTGVMRRLTGALAVTALHILGLF